MTDSIMFALALVAVVLIWGGYSLRSVNLKEYFKTRTGKGILKGIVLACLFAFLFAMSSMVFAGSWLNHAEVYAGLDYTKKANPVCLQGTVDDQSGSNIGLRVNVYEHERFSVNGKYTHHSCAFSQDFKSYDAVGIELNYRFWSK